MKQSTSTQRLVRFGLVSLLVGAASCGDKGAPNDASGLADDVLATVNGTPIRVAELQYTLSRRNKNEARKVDPAQMKAVLEELVELEVVRQAALGAKLDTDAAYVNKLRFLEAPFVQFQREELTKLYMRREVAEMGHLEDAELRQYFEAHAADFRSELRLMQILVRNDETRIRGLKKMIDDGATFEAAAAIRYPEKLPDGARSPWDIGGLRWTQVPTQWREALRSMKDGDVSDVIVGPNGRFWIVKLVQRQAIDGVTFEEVKPEIEQLLKDEKLTGLRQKTATQLRQQAKIVYVRDPETLPPPSERDED